MELTIFSLKGQPSPLHPRADFVFGGKEVPVPSPKITTPIPRQCSQNLLESPCLPHAQLKTRVVSALVRPLRASAGIWDPVVPVLLRQMAEFPSAQALTLHQKQCLRITAYFGGVASVKAGA